MAMIFVNLPGSWSHVYPLFEHSVWHGLAPADLIFPFFLLIMGVSLVFSSKNSSRNFTSTWNILKRSILLILLGWFVHTFPFCNWGEYWAGLKPLQFNWSETRYLGVLQRIGICYAVVALGFVWCGLNTLRILAPLILVFYSYALYLWNPMYPYDLVGNLVGSLDTFLFGTSHLWDKVNSFDPEGLFSTLPACINVIVGLELGILLKKNQNNLSQVLPKMGIYTIALTLLGLVTWIWVPINKSLWTASYVLLTSAVAVFVFGLMLWLIDIKKYKPNVLIAFEVFGTNALFAYILSELWAMVLWVGLMVPNPQDGNWITGYQGLFEWVFNPIFGPWWGSFVFSVSHLLVFGFLLHSLYQRKIWIKL